MKKKLSIVFATLAVLSVSACSSNANKMAQDANYDEYHMFEPIVQQPMSNQEIEFKIDDAKAFANSRLCLEDLAYYPKDSDNFVAKDADNVKTISTVNGFVLDQDITYEKDMKFIVTLTQRSTNGVTTLYIDGMKQVVVNSEGVESTYYSKQFTNRQFEHYMPVVQSFLADYKTCLETHK